MKPVVCVIPSQMMMSYPLAQIKPSKIEKIRIEIYVPVYINDDVVHLYEVQYNSQALISNFQA